MDISILFFWRTCQLKAGAGFGDDPVPRLKIRQYLSFLKKAAIFIYMALSSKASAKIPPFPPLKRGAEGGFKKAISKS
jgi:hypothetical protein